MAEWFVYCDLTYYPWGEIVEAETPEEAAKKADASLEDGVIVFPAGAWVHVAAKDPDKFVEHLRDR